eukprot:15465916-Alexandrium_andersonii.AAC.1
MLQVPAWRAQVRRKTAGATRASASTSECAHKGMHVGIDGRNARLAASSMSFCAPIQLPAQV